MMIGTEPKPLRCVHVLFVPQRLRDRAIFSLIPGSRIDQYFRDYLPEQLLK